MPASISCRHRPWHLPGAALAVIFGCGRSLFNTLAKTKKIAMPWRFTKVGRVGDIGIQFWNWICQHEANPGDYSHRNTVIIWFVNCRKTANPGQMFVGLLIWERKIINIIYVNIVFPLNWGLASHWTTTRSLGEWWWPALPVSRPRGIATWVGVRHSGHSGGRRWPGPMGPWVSTFPIYIVPWSFVPFVPSNLVTLDMSWRYTHLYILTY